MLAQKTDTLKQIVREIGRTAVAFSAGIDSTLMAKVAFDLLGKDAVALTAVSPSFPRTELAESEALARHIGIRHILLDTNEMDNPDYLENSPSRCYHCKQELYDVFWEYTKAHKIPYILDGANADDTGDYRPGRMAAQEHDVRSPLQEAGFSKTDVRALAKELGLPNWNKPAAACLASRIPYGLPVSLNTLTKIERAEIFLRGMGLKQFRVRHHDQVARIEALPEDFNIIIYQREHIAAELKKIGYAYITLDLLGFRSGSMNEVL